MTLSVVSEGLYTRVETTEARLDCSRARLSVGCRSSATDSEVESRE